MVGDNTSRRWPDDIDEWNRRAYLAATAGSTAGVVWLSGCVDGTGNGGGGDDGADENGAADSEAEDELPEGVSAEEFERGPVPDEYRTALSLGEEERDPDGLTPKADVDFSEYDEADEHSSHEPGMCCANCADYIPDKNGDTFGACAEVEGYIDGADWCAIYEELPEPSVPDGLSEDELATAPVPDEYQTATSQAGEQRDPDALQTQADVNLMESVEAIAEEVTPPGQSCGNCAEFIPDMNGDTWGACAKVEGYIAVEDWCTLWEHSSEEG